MGLSDGFYPAKFSQSLYEAEASRCLPRQTGLTTVSFRTCLYITRNSILRILNLVFVGLLTPVLMEFSASYV